MRRNWFGKVASLLDLTYSESGHRRLQARSFGIYLYIREIGIMVKASYSESLVSGELYSSLLELLKVWVLARVKDSSGSGFIIRLITFIIIVIETIKKGINGQLDRFIYKRIANIGC